VKDHPNILRQTSLDKFDNQLQSFKATKKEEYFLSCESFQKQQHIQSFT